MTITQQIKRDWFLCLRRPHPWVYALALFAATMHFVLIPALIRFEITAAGGEIVQRHDALTPMPLEWEARIWRVENGHDRLVCGGAEYGGTGTYLPNVSPRIFTKSRWTGDPHCAEAMTPGVYYGTAQWTLRLGPLAWRWRARTQPFEVTR